MRKVMLSGIMLLAFVFSSITMNAQTGDKKCCNKNFVDANNDGICDNCGKAKTAKCKDFVDANNDGICDKKATHKCGKMGSSVADSTGCKKSGNTGCCKHKAK